MKIDPYYASAGIALVVILVILFTQRSNWNKDKFILSADDSGNLTPISEDYFDIKEKALLAKVDAKLVGVLKRGHQIKLGGYVGHKCRYAGCSQGGHFLGTPSTRAGDEVPRMTYNDDGQRMQGDVMTNRERILWTIH